MSTVSIIVVCFIALLLIFNFSLKVKIVFNIIENKGRFNASFLSKIKLFSFGFKIKNKDILVTLNNGKQKIIDLTPEGDLVFYDQLQKELFKRLTLKNAYIFVDVGMHDNAFLTSMLTSYVKIIFSIILAKLSHAKKRVKIINNVYPKYNKETLKLTIKAKTTLSMFGSVNSLIIARLKANKINKSKEKEYETNRI